MTPDPSRSWPPRLRRALARRMAEIGIGPVPRGLVIRYHPSRTSWRSLGRDEARIEIRHSPGPTESMSGHTHVDAFDGSPEAISRFLDAAVQHARAMLRRQARFDALVAAGHDPLRPPFHTLEANPLVALAMRLVETGRAGGAGDAHISDGLLQLANWEIIVDGGRPVRLLWSRGLLLPDRHVPETVAAAIAGRRLGDVVALPACGDASIDARVADLLVETAAPAPDGLKLTLAPGPVAPLRPASAGEVGGWRAMPPVPLG